MGEPVSALQLYLPKPIQVELSDKALKLMVPEIFGNDFGLHSIHIEDIDASFRLVPGDDV